MSKKEKHPGGAPPMYKKPEEMKKKIDAYFKECEGQTVLDKEGNPVINRFGKVVKENEKPPTITGLALSLGFTSRQALLNYQAKDQFIDTVTRAKSKVEEYAEGMLFTNVSNGARFNLTNNFKGWKEKQEIEQTTVDATNDLTPEERRKRITELESKLNE